jgi:hypothetical protein
LCSLAKRNAPAQRSLSRLMNDKYRILLLLCSTLRAYYARNHIYPVNSICMYTLFLRL